MTDSAQPIKDCDSDSPKPIAHAPSTHTTPGECSKQGDGTSGPVAWWLKGSEYDTGCEYEYVSLLKESAEVAAAEGGTVVPLYRSPTLTDSQREAVETAALAFDRDEQPSVNRLADVLRGIGARPHVPLLTAQEREAVEYFAETRKPLARLCASNNREQYVVAMRGLLARCDLHSREGGERCQTSSSQ